MAKRRVASGGGAGRGARTAIALILVGFVLVTTGVIARRTYGVQQQRAIEALQRTRDALVAERIRLEGAIGDASSRARLQPIAEQQLNMHIPKPDQQVLVKRTPGSDSSASSKTGTPRPAHDSL
ncbi:MAG TPA: cell division protein FtsL [Gemmatimonadaceae bacterium]|nr:cell division protein FtsL [Gemmatimonadaceae bacterium]